MLKNLNSLHHAYLVLGVRERIEDYLQDFFNKEGSRLSGSPDYFVFKEPLFGIAEAREVVEKANRKAFVDRKIFLIAPERITLEAQSALLKTFEDPVPDTHFFLIMRNVELILPTLRSRMQVVSFADIEPLFAEAEKFLKCSLKERLSFVRKFLDAEKNASVFLDELLVYHKKMNVETLKLEKIYKARLLSDDRGVSARLILEHLAVVL